MLAKTTLASVLETLGKISKEKKVKNRLIKWMNSVYR